MFFFTIAVVFVQQNDVDELMGDYRVPEAMYVHPEHPKAASDVTSHHLMQRWKSPRKVQPPPIASLNGL